MSQIATHQHGPVENYLVFDRSITKGFFMVPPDGCICQFTVHGSTYTRTAHEGCKAKHSILEWKDTVPVKLKYKLSPSQQQAWDWLDKNKQDPGWIGWPTA